MDRICKNCKHWKEYEFTEEGSCKKLIGLITEVETKWDGYYSDFQIESFDTIETFGCNLFEEK